MKVSKTSEGLTQVEMPSGKHPASHFETSHVRIEPAENGFTVEHHKRLKKKFENQHHMSGGYQEPEQHVFADAASMHDHLKTIFKDSGGERKGPKSGVSEDEGE